MSGGTFNYIQKNYELDEAIERIEEEIDNGGWSPETIAELKIAVESVKKMKIYLERVDYLLAMDDGEDSFHARLKEELETNLKNGKI